MLRSSAGSWDDAVEIYFDGVNVKTDPSLYQIGSAVFLDNESYMDGFEAGTTSASANQETGNIDLDFGSQPVSSVRIRYFSTDDAVGNPSSQFIGISDLIFVSTAIPEPGMVPLVVMLSGLALTRRPFRVRRRASPCNKSNERAGRTFHFFG